MKTCRRRRVGDSDWCPDHIDNHEPKKAPAEKRTLHEFSPLFALKFDGFCASCKGKMKAGSAGRLWNWQGKKPVHNGCAQSCGETKPQRLPTCRNEGCSSESSRGFDQCWMHRNRQDGTRI